MDTTRIKRQFIENSRGYWKANALILILYFVALTADGISTMHFMLHEGVESEMHPAVNLIARMTGPIWGPVIAVIGKAVAGVIVAIYWRRFGWIILLTVSIISFWAAWYNICGWQYYEPGIIKWWPF